MLAKTAVGHIQHFRLSDVLLFDKIYSHSVDGNIKIFREKNHPFANTLEWLQSEGIIEEIPTNEYNKKIEETYPIKPDIGPNRNADYIANYLLDFVLDQKIRLWEMTVQTRGDFCVLLTDEFALDNPMSKTAKSIQILDFTFKYLAQPHWDISINQLNELRSNPKAQESLRSIHGWLKAVSMVGVVDKVIVEDLIYRVHTYNEYLSSLIKVIYSEERFFCFASEELLNDKSRLKIPESYGKLFLAAPRVVSLMDPEIADPGSELAYIRKTK